VTVGFQNNVLLKEKDRCCKIIKNFLSSKIIEYDILHEVYRLSNDDVQDRRTCLKVRGSECGNNYPPESQLYEACLKDVDWLCRHGYPNNTVAKKNEYVKRIQNELLAHLIKNNLKVNKKKFDEIISAGLFDDLGSKMGGLDTTYKNVYDTLGNIFNQSDYKLDGLVEKFDMIDYNTNYHINMIVFVIVLFICLYAYTHYYY
jgi:hypothetical protein